GVHGITFSNLPYGTYNIKVYLHGSPDVNVCEVTVHVHTVWYNHWLAWLVYLVLFSLLCYKGVQYGRQWLRTKNELKEHQHMDELNKSKLQMFTNISHEIRTPMTLIISPLEKLMKDDRDEANRRLSYDTMHRNASRILNLVNQLMDVRKIENGKMILSLSRQDIIPIIGNICESFVGKAAEKNITFTYIHDGIDQLFANIDLQHFDKIFANLISNAMRFAPEKGVVTVSVSKLSAEKAEIAVNDNGIGIPDEEREHIFERFYQVRSDENNAVGGLLDARMNLTGGTGVGLHLAKALVEMHNGTIRVDKRIEGEGCRFIVELPLVEQIESTQNSQVPLSPQVEAITSPTVEMPQEVSTDNTSEKTSVVATTVESLPL
ncbi:MAG: HAMP domain-containing histidine kinase, partial [Bacteroidaceae bacterium]|nr:HAMP domain-containing histidine kinase [Bacteroidaceae bacterium]